MAGNKVTLEFAGDATKLAKEANKASDDITKFGKSALDTGKDLKDTGKSSDDFLTKIGKLGSGVSGMSDAIDSAGATVQAFADIQSASANKLQKQERALNDVRQAQEDYAQALRDGKQAAIDTDQAEVDLTQAHLDEKTALKEYKDALHEFGAGSDEASQAQIDLKQAGVDVKQALEDQQQATRDASQANIDAKGAQLDLNDAMTEAHPPEIQKWADQINMYAPILSGLVGIMGLVTAAQWLWNIAQLASPTTWIVLAIVALVAIIVVIATKTTWFQTIWKKSWGWIKDAASNVWEWMKKLPDRLKGVFSKAASFISAPFRSAFNGIADAWNNTVGRLHWTIPWWVPWPLGGRNIDAPTLPKFHKGGTVPGAPGSEMMAILQAGETVTPAGQSSGAVIEIRSGGSQLDDLLVDVLSRAVSRRGGNVQLVLGSRNA